MKYVFTGGPYTQFMGRTFAFGKPVEVNDNATLKALEGRRDFAAYVEAPPKAEESPLPVVQVINMDACPKCGKSLGRGKYMHVKFCRGTVEA